VTFDIPTLYKNPYLLTYFTGRRTIYNIIAIFHPLGADQNCS